jgi:hypothetical protein
MSTSRQGIKYKDSKILEESCGTHDQQKGEHKEDVSFPLAFWTCEVISERQECYANDKVNGPVYREGDGRKSGDGLYGRNRDKKDGSGRVRVLTYSGETSGIMMKGMGPSPKAKQLQAYCMSKDENMWG